MRLLGLLHWIVPTLLVAAATALSAPMSDTSRPPYPTGVHQQWGRQFFTSNHGLPAGPVAALAAVDGTLFAIVEQRVFRRLPDRWAEEREPAGATALLANGDEALVATAEGVWRWRGGRWRRPAAGDPTGVRTLAAAPGGRIWALDGGGKLWVDAAQETRFQPGPPTDDAVRQPNGLWVSPAGEVLLSTAEGLYRRGPGNPGWDRVGRPKEGQPDARVRNLAWLDATHLVAATDQGLGVASHLQHWTRYTGAEGLPVLDLTHVAVGSDRTVWLGSAHGLIRWKDGAFTYFAGPRWLPNDRVTALAPAAEGSVWVGTAAGVALLSQRSLTLADKAEIYQKDLESRDRRHGYVTVMQLPAPGELKGARQEISDNDGLWTAMYIGSQAFRYSVTRSPQARAQAWRSMQALLRLESITGLSGFPARAISKVDEPGHAGRSEGEWHPSPVEPGWMWKGDTSSDEIDGHFFAFQLYYDLVANEDEKRQIRATCKRIMDRILKDGYYLVDLDGKPTRWGVWAPEKLNDDPEWWAERGLNSLEILSHLKVAHHIVGDPRYAQAYRELIDRHGYAVNTLGTKVVTGGEINHSDDELAFLSYYPLLQLEKDPALRTLYTASLRRSWEYERPEASPLWNFIYGASTGQPCDVDRAVQALQEIPLDLVKWPTRNSVRADLKYDPAADRFNRRQLLQPLPWTERPLHKWNGNPFQADGGDGREEEDQTMWLLPYWMGRSHRLIQ